MRKLSVILGLLLSLGSIFCQTKIVNGKILNQQGQPIAFATVRVKGTKIGAGADAEGNFSIKAKSGETLIVSGTGITNKEVPVAGSGA